MKSSVKKRPILFSGSMVQALLAGTKTQTRRIVKDAPDGLIECHYNGGQLAIASGTEGGCTCELPKCPYGQPGDQLWVREGFSYNLKNELVYRASEQNDSWDEAACLVGWKPSIHMPRTACRLLLEITAVRVERVQDISEADAVAEGVAVVESFKDSPHYENYLDEWAFEYTARDSYATLWDKINGEGSFLGANPWVWVVEFKVIGSIPSVATTTSDRKESASG